MTSATLLSVQTGSVAPLGPDAIPSGFVKHVRAGAVQVGPLGLDGDAQADLTVHGGAEKAAYGYAAGHYPLWAAEFPEHAALFAAGGVGENLTIGGMDESAICVGDIHGIGTALLQVCQPRQPCFKFVARFGDNRLPKAMVRNGRSGWYYRVLVPGAVGAGDAVTLLDRPNPEFPFSRLVTIVYRNNATLEELAQLAWMPGLASQWQMRAPRRSGRNGSLQRRFPVASLFSDTADMLVPCHHHFHLHDDFYRRATGQDRAWRRWSWAANTGPAMSSSALRWPSLVQTVVGVIAGRLIHYPAGGAGADRLRAGISGLCGVVFPAQCRGGRS